MRLTKDQKLLALEFKYYSEGVWYPKAGDLYTTARNDLEVYRVIDVRDGVVTTEYTEHGTGPSEWAARRVFDRRFRTEESMDP